MVPKLLISESPIAFLPSLATAIGVNQAIALQQIHYCSRTSRHDGWVQMPIVAGERRDNRRRSPSWADEFPFWSGKTIHRIFRDLREAGWVEVEVVPVASGLGREARVRVAYAAIDRLAEGQSAQSVHTGAGLDRSSRPREDNLSRLPSLRGKKKTTEEKTTASRLPSSKARRSVAERNEDPDVVRLCEQLAARIRANDPSAELKPDGRSWRSAMRLLLEAGRTPEQVGAAIDFAASDAFESAVILSPTSLRRGMTRLVRKMGDVSPAMGAQRGVDVDERVRRLREQAATERRVGEVVDGQVIDIAATEEEGTE